MAKIKLEYLWLDGYTPVPNLRGKTCIKEGDVENWSLEDCPMWGFDGSSTKQAEGSSSDCMLKPVALFPDSTRKNAFLVMCEVLMPDGSAHPSNARATIPEDEGLWVGLEQEYFLMQDGRALGWPEEGYPQPQGKYYCGAGFSSVGDIARSIVEEHLDLCLDAGINHEGINGEVAKGQWEFQIFGKEKELSLKIYDQNNNGIIDSSDHIEFYATKNDGWIDYLAYDTITNMPDEYYSLFNDTIQYYLTWNNNFNNKRTIDESDINFNNYNSNNFCWKNNIVKFNSQYVLGRQQSGLSSPKYELGEGWAGPRHQKNGSYTENIPSSNYQNTGPNAFGKINIVTANSSSANLNNENHNTQVHINNVLYHDLKILLYSFLEHHS